MPDTASDAVIFNRLQNLYNSKVWKQKNYRVWNDSIETENQVELCEIHLLAEWHLVQQVSTGQQQSMQHATDVVWKKSSLGSLECNIDASLSSHLNLVRNWNVH